VTLEIEVFSESAGQCHCCFNEVDGGIYLVAHPPTARRLPYPGRRSFRPRTRMTDGMNACLYGKCLSLFCGRAVKRVLVSVDSLKGKERVKKQ
jgi:hypothetical protein